MLPGAFCFGLAVASMVVMTLSLISEHFVGRLQRVYFLAGICDAVGSTIGPAVWVDGSPTLTRPTRLEVRILLQRNNSSGARSVRLAQLADVGVQENARSERKIPPFSLMKSILCKPTIYAISVLGLLHGLTQGGAVSFFGQLFQKTFQIDAAQAAVPSE